MRRLASKQLLAEAAQALRIADGREAARHVSVGQEGPARVVLLQVRAAVARQCTRRTARRVVPHTLQPLLIGRVGLGVGSRRRESGRKRRRWRRRWRRHAGWRRRGIHRRLRAIGMKRRRPRLAPRGRRGGDGPRRGDAQRRVPLLAREEGKEQKRVEHARRHEQRSRKARRCHAELPVAGCET